MTEVQSQATFHEGMTRADFATAGERGGNYYPFASERHNYAETLNAPWQGSLPESSRGEDGVYRREGFDLQAAVDTVPGHILEVGGPSQRGYEFLDGVELPERPIMMNIVGSRPERKGTDSLTPVDRLVLDALADVRALPVADESLGMLMGSNLAMADQRKLQAIGTDPMLSNEQKGQLVQDEISRNYADAQAAIDSDDTKRLTRHESPLIATIAQAARTLKPNGLFLLHNLSPADVHIAQALGLELVMHTPLNRAKWRYGTYENMSEATFRKTA